MEENTQVNVTAAESERVALEKELEDIRDEYERGELTTKGFKKRSLKVKFKVLEVEYKTGELTGLGYESKKKRSMDELEKTDSSDSDAIKSAHQLKEVASSSKMSDSINKLFGKCPNPSTSKVKSITRMAKEAPSTKKGTKRKATVLVSDGENAESADVKKQVDRPIVVEVICMPNMTMTIPRGHYKTKLEDAGRVKYLKYTKKEPSQAIKESIIGLFPSVFGNAIRDFNFLDARCKYLEKMDVPPKPHCEWNGAAIMTLTGQGRLYILPVDGCQTSQQPQQETQQTKVPCHGTIASSSIGSLTMNSCTHSSISAFGTSSAHCTHSMDLDVDPANASRHVDEESLPSVIKEQIESNFVGKAILEYAEKRAPFYPQYSNDLLPGETELYKINWRIDLWVAWRMDAGKKPLKESPDGYFYVVTEEDFEEYSKFCEALKFLPSVPVNSYVIKQTELLNYYKRSMKVQIADVEMYGAKFCVLSELKLSHYQKWVVTEIFFPRTIRLRKYGDCMKKIAERDLLRYFLETR